MYLTYCYNFYACIKTFDTEGMAYTTPFLTQGADMTQLGVHHDTAVVVGPIPMTYLLISSTPYSTRGRNTGRPR